MPVYDYRCEKCETRFERDEPMSAEPSTACITPGCSGPAKRLISRVGIAFKGTGFYVTDSSSSPTAKPAASE